MDINVLDIKGQETGRKVILNENIFGIEPNDHVLYLDVKQYLADQRQGTAKTKERSEHAGSTRKLGRQKGGGGARRGDINSPVLARKSALAYKAKESAIIVVEDFDFDAPKTKEFINVAKNLKVDGKKVLLVLPEAQNNVYLSARNSQKTQVTTAEQVNTYGILHADVLVVTENALKTIDELLTK